MPSKNITIDNISPLINYQPTESWSEGNSTDPLMNKYRDSTFTLCVDSGASASFSFNGTGIWIYGAKRGNHGAYNVTLDGETTNLSGQSPDPGLFQTPLFGATSLAHQMHFITITNAGTDPNRNSDFLDIDFITWESTFGTDSDEVTETIIEDSDSRFVYQPASVWNTNPPNINSFSGQSGHGTTSTGASVTFTFVGSTVQIFGTTGPSNAPYSVSLDGGKASTHNATKYANATQVPIFYADDLGPGQHNVKFTNQPALTGEGLNIDFAQVNTVPSVSSSSPKSGLGGGAIAGIVIGILAVVGILVGLFFFLRRRRNASITEKPSAFAPQAFMSAPPPSTHPSGTGSWTSPLSPGSQSYGGESYQPYSQSSDGPQRTATMSSSRPSHQPQASVVGSSSVMGSSNPARSEFSDLPNPYSASSTSGSSNAYPTINAAQSRPLPPNPAGPHAYPPTKRAAARLPPSAGQSLAHVPEDQLRANRMNIDGRPQDLGHVPVDGEMPPPDYSQATERYNSHPH